MQIAFGINIVKENVIHTTKWFSQLIEQAFSPFMKEGYCPLALELGPPVFFSF